MVGNRAVQLLLVALETGYCLFRLTSRVCCSAVFTALYSACLPAALAKHVCILSFCIRVLRLHRVQPTAEWLLGLCLLASNTIAIFTCQLASAISFNFFVRTVCVSCGFKMRCQAVSIPISHSQPFSSREDNFLFMWLWHEAPNLAAAALQAICGLNIQPETWPEVASGTSTLTTLIHVVAVATGVWLPICKSIP